MDRLTERIENGIRIKGCSTVYPIAEHKSAPKKSAIVRLAAYEDIGLTPEEIVKIIGRVDKAVNKRDKKMITQFIADSLNYFTKMHCLKRIDKACDKYHRLERRLKLQGCVVNEMIKRYKELYGEDLRNKV